VLFRSFTVTDACGNTATTVATFTIIDTQAPTISCPTNVATGNTDANECYSTTVVLGTATATDNCSTVIVTNNAPAQFPAGTTTVTWTATDACGNTATCTQIVVVTDTTQPPTISCPSSVEETIAADLCSKTGVSPGTPTVWDNCPNPVLTYTLTGATTGNGVGTLSNTTFNIGVTTVTYTVTDLGGNTRSCAFTVTIRRLNIPPATIQCATSPLPVNVISGCAALVTVAPPVITDICQTTTYTVTNDYTGTATATANYPVGTTTVTWTIRDNSGNVTTCVQTVTVTDNQPPVFTACPASVSESIAADQCTKSNVTLDPLNYSDNCSSTLTYTIVDAIGGTTSGTGVISVSYPYEVGTNTVTYVVTDASGLTATCTFTVTIRRLNIPAASVQCAASPSPVNVISGCDALVTVAPPVITDICRTATFTVTNDYTGTATATANYPVGTTTVTWTIRDNSGNVTTCVQTVTVTDNQPPVFTACPASVSESIAADQCTKSNVTLDPLNYSDNCSSTLTYTIVDAIGGTTSGTGVISVSYPYEVGTNSVTYVVTDAGGLTATCTFTVTIRRLNIPPASVQCPGSPAAVNVVSGCEAMVTVAPPVIIDICRTATFTVTNDYTGTATATANYPVGTTTVTWTIRDNSGNVTTCVQTVTVIGIPPVIACPPSITAQAEFEKTYRVLNDVDLPTLDPPVVTLSCPIESLTWIMTGATTDTSSATGTNTLTTHSFNLGVTNVTYTVTDNHGLSDSCTFTVTIIGKPVIDCPATITSTTDPGVCTKALDPGVPVLHVGSPPATSWSWVMTGATTGSGGNDGSTPSPVSLNPFTFNAGVTTITWTACNISGCSTPCTQEIIVEDKEPPTFTSAPITECVDLLTSAVYTSTSPNPNSGIEPNLIVKPSPDYYTFKAGDTSLDLTNLDDNCCGTASLTVNWRIEFANVPDPLNPTGPVLTHDDIIGTGQPSTYGSDILMWGDGVNYTPVTHSIFYWVVDCNGNSTLDTIGEQREEIIITPRPEIIKMN